MTWKITTRVGSLICNSVFCRSVVFSLSIFMPVWSFMWTVKHWSCSDFFRRRRRTWNLGVTRLIFTVRCSLLMIKIKIKLIDAKALILHVISKAKAIRWGSSSFDSGINIVWRITNGSTLTLFIHAEKWHVWSICIHEFFVHISSVVDAIDLHFLLSTLVLQDYDCHEYHCVSRFYMNFISA